MKINFLPVIVLMSSIQLTAQAADLRSLDAEIRFHDNYSDLRVMCENFVSDLRQAQRQATRLKDQGKLTLGAQLMRDALKAKAAIVDKQYRAMANPNTVEAVIQSAKLSDLIIKLVDQNQAIFQRTSGAFKYKIVNDLTNFVIDVNEQLDSQFFYSRINNCRHDRCYNQAMSVLEDKYYKTLGQLSRRLLEVYQVNHRALGTNKIELTMASAFARSSAEIMATSMFRRDMRRSIIRLVDASNEATNVVSSNDEYAMMDVLPWVNEEIEFAKQEIPVCE